MSRKLSFMCRASIASDRRRRICGPVTVSICRMPSGCAWTFAPMMLPTEVKGPAADVARDTLAVDPAEQKQQSFPHK